MNDITDQAKGTEETPIPTTLSAEQASLARDIIIGDVTFDEDAAAHDEVALILLAIAEGN